MFVSISLIGLQRRLIEADKIRIPISDKIQVVSDLFNYMSERYPELSLRKEHVLVTVNNIESPLDYRLRENDEVSFMPHIGGG